METLKLITQKTGEFPVTVYYEDTDLTGFVYHANYLKYFERAREELIGIDSLKELYDLGYHFVVKDVHLNFKKPAYHADSLIVKSRVVFDSPVIVNCYQEVVNIKTNISLVLGTVKLVVVNKKSQPSRIPANWVKSILN